MFEGPGFGFPSDTSEPTSSPKKIVGYNPPRNEVNTDVIRQKLTELRVASQTKTAILRNPRGRAI